LKKILNLFTKQAKYAKKYWNRLILNKKELDYLLIGNPTRMQLSP